MDNFGNFDSVELKKLQDELKLEQEKAKKLAEEKNEILLKKIQDELKLEQDKAKKLAEEKNEILQQQMRIRGNVEAHSNYLLISHEKIYFPFKFLKI